MKMNHPCRLRHKYVEGIGVKEPCASLGRVLFESSHRTRMNALSQETPLPPPPRTLFIIFFWLRQFIKMRQSRARAEDSRLDVERRLKYLGAARVSLDVLRLYWDGRDLRREPDRKHVEILKECFHKEGCHPLQLRNHVPAKIDQRCLDAALRDSGVSARQLLTQQPNGCPELVFPHGFKLDYLHGLHRIEAAREFLSPTDKWWTVDLYRSGKLKQFELGTS
jgi:hypothetical protein